MPCGCSTCRIEDMSEMPRSSAFLLAPLPISMTRSSYQSMNGTMGRPGASVLCLRGRGIPKEKPGRLLWERGGDRRRRRQQNEVGYCEAVGAAEGFTEPVECWRGSLVVGPRGLCGVCMFTGDKAADAGDSIARVLPNAAYQRNTVCFCKVSESRLPKGAAMLRAIHVVGSVRHLRSKRCRWRWARGR